MTERRQQPRTGNESRETLERTLVALRALRETWLEVRHCAHQKDDFDAVARVEVKLATIDREIAEIERLLQD